MKFRLCTPPRRSGRYQILIQPRNDALSPLLFRTETPLSRLAIAHLLGAEASSSRIRGMMKAAQQGCKEVLRPYVLFHVAANLLHELPVNLLNALIAIDRYQFVLHTVVIKQLNGLSEKDFEPFLYRPP
jgi:hypothetical protein